MTIAPVKFVITFEVDPAKQPQLVDVLQHSINEVLRHRAGFTGARLLVSSDGARVINETSR